MIGTLCGGAIQPPPTAATGLPEFLHFSPAVMLPLLAAISWGLFLPYFAGAVIFIIGVSTVIRQEVSSAGVADKILSFGPVFLAVPLAVFGAGHFVFAESMVPMVPSGIPWPLCWIGFVWACV